MWLQRYGIPNGHISCEVFVYRKVFRVLHQRGVNVVAPFPCIRKNLYYAIHADKASSTECQQPITPLGCLLSRQLVAIIRRQYCNPFWRCDRMPDCSRRQPFLHHSLLKESLPTWRNSKWSLDSYNENHMIYHSAYQSSVDWKMNKPRKKVPSRLWR